MKNNLFNKAVVVSILIIGSSKTYAQQHAQEGQDSSDIDYSVDYTSNNVYSGRSDSLNTGYLSPSITYTAKSGIYLSATVSYFAAASRIDFFEFGGGYDFDWRKWKGSVSMKKYFYNRESYNISAGISGEIAATFKYQRSFITPIFSSFINVGKIPDVGFSIGAEKKLYALKDNLEMIPSLNLHAGTQHFYNSYITKRKSKKSGSGASIADAGQLRVTDLEIEYPLYYYWKKFDLHFAPVYCIPVNPNTILMTNKTTSTSNYAYQEKLNNIFYWSAGITYTR